MHAPFHPTARQLGAALQWLTITAWIATLLVAIAA